MSSRDSEPLAYVRGVAVDLTVVLIALHVIFTLVGVFFSANGAMDAWATWTTLSVPQGIINGKLWQLVSYPFYHNIVRENIWFALNMLMLWWFGREVERHVGKWNYLCLYFSLSIIPALLAFGASSVLGTARIAGANDVHLGVFMAFVFLYPQAMFLGGIRAIWFAVVILAIYSLMAIAGLDWMALLVMWSAVAVAYLSLKFYSLGSWAERYQDWVASRQARRIEKRCEKLKVAQEDFHQEVDSILEKISREGIGSLTKDERLRLERARAKMLKKDQK